MHYISANFHRIRELHGKSVFFQKLTSEHCNSNRKKHGTTSFFLWHLYTEDMKYLKQHYLLLPDC